MTPLEVVKQAEGMQFTDVEEETSTLELLPPLSAEELRTLEASLPCPLPEEARELFAYCRGFTGGFGEGGETREVDLSGLSGGFGMEEILPHAVPLADDSAGNFWVADLTSDSTIWGPIFYVRHDAPVIVYQTDSFAHFVSGLLRYGQDREGELGQVTEGEASRIWSDNPGVLPHSHCLTCGDPDLQAFARSLDETWQFIDLRHPRLGDGFSWGRYGANTQLRRHGEQRIFAYQMRKSFWGRVFGRGK